MAGKQRKQLVYRNLRRSTKYSQNLVISNVHTVADKPTAPVSQREKNCPTYSQICHKCGRTGHFQRVWKSKKKTDVKEVVTDGTDSEANQISVGELAGIFAVTAALHKVTRSVNKIKKYGRMFQNFLGLRWW